MCIGTAAIIAGGIGASTSAVGAVGSAAATSQNAGYQAQVARNNAVTASQNARYASAAGAEQAEAAGLQSAAAGGRIKAAQAANNIDVNSGSAAKVQQSQRILGAQQTQNVANKAALQSYGYRTQATADEGQAALDQAEADQAPLEGALAAGGTLLGDASSIGFKFGSMQNPAALPSADTLETGNGAGGPVW